MSRLTIPLSCLLLLTTNVVPADEPEMDSVRKLLAKLEGEFKAMVVVGSDEVPGTRTAKWRTGNYVVSEEHYETGPKDDGRFSVHILEGWDPDTRTIKQFMFSSEGANSTTHFKVVGNQLLGLRSGIDADGTRWTANVKIEPVGQEGFDLYIDKQRTDVGEERPDVKVEFRRK